MSALLALPLLADALPRSRVLRAEFMRAHPCPANGHVRGACPGWQVDHIQPLCAGGRDDLDNLHWLAEADHAAKTRKDVAACRGRIYRAPAPGGETG